MLLIAAAFAAALASAPATGPATGARVPAFELRDQHNAVRTLVDLKGPRGLVLVFFRSADW